MSVESQVVTLLFAVGQILKKVDALQEIITAHEADHRAELVQLRQEIEIRAAVHQAYLQDWGARVVRDNLLWLRETEAGSHTKNVEL